MRQGKGMRGAKVEAGNLFSYLSPEQRIRKDHPLAIRVIVDRGLAALNSHFDSIYSDLGRPSIPPEYLLMSWNQPFRIGTLRLIPGAGRGMLLYLLGLEPVPQIITSPQF